MKGLADVLLTLQEYQQLLDSVKKQQGSVGITGVSETQKAHLIYALYQHAQKPALIVTYSDMQAQKLYEDLRFLMGQQNVELFPAKEFIFYEIEAYSQEVVQQRLQVLNRLCEHPERMLIVTTIEALMQLVTPYNVYTKHRKRLKVGMIYSLDTAAEQLTVMGYERVDMVEGKGQFSIRGGILDIFPVDAQIAYRVEFFDDEIDSIRELDVMSQRSNEKVAHIVVTIAQEAVFTQQDAQGLIDRMQKIITTVSANTQEHVKVDIEKIQQQHYFPSIDKYLPILYNQNITQNTATLLQYLHKEAIVFWDEPARVKQRAQNVAYMFDETIKDMLEKGLAIKQSVDLITRYDALLTSIKRVQVVALGAFTGAHTELRPVNMINMVTKTLHSFHGKLTFLYDDLAAWKKKSYRIVILAGEVGRAKELVTLLSQQGFDSIYVDTVKTIPLPGQIVITAGSVHKGFEYPLIQFAVVSDKEIFKQQKKVKKKRFNKSSSAIKVFTDLTVGDYVVHQTHGIGQYIGIEQLEVEGVKKDYLKIKYQRDDFLYVPTSQLDLVQKYIGGESKRVKLHKMGGAEWTKVKSKVRKSVEELAEALIVLYAERHTAKGYAFSKDTPWQYEFEDTFPYEETTDQLRSIEEVKSDMEKEVSMERLICGDVGYGKTEVAIRATFKAVMDGKQVAYLVPTTILAQQHYSNFTQRMKDFPVAVEMLSRFRSASQQKSIIKRLKTGEIDIVIGTHRILQKDLEFKDLGLLIIDEEQRFGVTHKEKLKQVRKNVDVLTLTATPIPRTLHMSMIGVRDMSVLEEPPEDRYPVQTYVIEYNDSIIQDAIIREINRGGQVYYLYNRVMGIQKIAQQIKQMIPEARVAVAHGQMNEHELEEIMLKVLQDEIDVLVCTTIIETGLDIPNVNTIIIEDADKMGLAQLYQLRGRVGRTNRMAYAYITYRRDKVIQESAQKRLQAIKEFTEFGSGFKIAMRDLEIRGAGNLLGAKQHGHMEAVGYDTYCKMLEQAVKAQRGESVQPEIVSTVDINVDAYIPATYIQNHNQRVDIYKKIASIQEQSDLYEVEEEIEDRYGDLIQPIKNLTQIALIKNMAARLQIVSVAQKAKTIQIQFMHKSIVDMDTIFKLCEKFSGKLLFTASDKPYLTYKDIPNNAATLLDNIKIVLQALKELQTR